MKNNKQISDKQYEAASREALEVLRELVEMHPWLIDPHSAFFAEEMDDSGVDLRRILKRAAILRALYEATDWGK